MATNFDLQYPDGDIVLVIAERRYVVHKSILGAHCGVFADMFTIPTPVGEEIPVVQIHDEQEPFTLFLCALYGQSLEPHLPKGGQSNVALISAVIDLADKYNVSQPDMRSLLIPFIQRDWPKTLVAWDENEAYIEKLRAELRKANKPDTVDDLLPEPACVIRFAHVYKESEKRIQLIPKFLPAAFYHLARIPSWADSDNGVPCSPAFKEGFRSAKRSLLSHQDWLCLHEGLDSLRCRVAEIAFVEFRKEAKRFEGASDKEQEAMIGWWQDVAVEKLVGCHSRDPLRELKVLMDALGEGKTGEVKLRAIRRATGTQYRRAIVKFLEGERQNLWESLSSYFSLWRFF